MEDMIAELRAKLATLGGSDGQPNENPTANEEGTMEQRIEYYRNQVLSLR
jgi:hypothetical protein